MPWFSARERPGLSFPPPVLHPFGAVARFQPPTAFMVAANARASASGSVAVEEFWVAVANETRCCRVGSTGSCGCTGAFGFGAAFALGAAALSVRVTVEVRFLTVTAGAF